MIGGSSGGGVGPIIVELPLGKIRRPLMRTRSNDQNKVKDLMDSISEIGLQVPVNQTRSLLLRFKLLRFIFNKPRITFFFKKTNFEEIIKIEESNCVCV